MQLLSDALGLDGLLQRRAEQYSQGERMRVALARAIVHAPHHIILDEPTNGLDLASVRRLRQMLRFLASPAGGGHCVLISSHVMGEVEKLADSVIILAGGMVRAVGSVQEIVSLTQSRDLEDAFFSLAFGDAA
jgi:sodium transport system ATP-binding protein